MVEKLGMRFEGLAAAFLPALFKVLVITVQVSPLWSRGHAPA
jgi:hypothetical protein